MCGVASETISTSTRWYLLGRRTATESRAHDLPRASCIWRDSVVRTLRECAGREEVVKRKLTKRQQWASCG